ncbi:MAG: SHOCT domain-containing protein [Terrabacter sp.]
MWWYDSGPGWFGWLMMALAMLVFWGAIVLGAVAAYRALRRDHERTTTDRDDPVKILEQRFARGEIDSDEFSRRREMLRPTG